MNDIFNICNIMKSNTMKDFYKDIKLSDMQKELIIVKSYNTLSAQLKYLKLLFNYSNQKEKNNINQMMQLIKLFIDLFYTPEKIYKNKRFFYIVEEIDLKCNISNDLSINDLIKPYIKKTYEYNNINDIFEEIGSDCETDEAYNIKLFVIDEEIYNIINFYCVKINNIFEPIRCFINQDKFKKLEIPIKRYNNTTAYRFDLPFKNGDRIKINIPIMEKPLYGYIYRDLVGNYEWYNFLYSNKNMESSYIDLSHINIDRCYPQSNYSIFDWVDK